MSEKYPNALNNTDEEMDAIYADGEHLIDTVNVNKIAARCTDIVMDLPAPQVLPTSPENWEEEDRNPVYIDLREAA